MDVFEELAMRHLCRDGFEFLNPQFEIADGWACPDFVSLNPKNRTVRVVEVSVAYKVGGLVAKINDCEDRWFRHLRKHFASSSLVSAEWVYRVTIYIRRYSDYNPDKLNKTVADLVNDVRFEDIGYPWEDWYLDRSA